MANVFLSHVDEDFPVIEEIAGRLEGNGWTTWYYERDSVPGIPHPTQTREAIEQADAFAVLISEQCLDDPKHVRREIFRAMNLDKHFLPLLLDVSYADVEQRQPQWDDAFAGAVATPVLRSDPAAVVPRVVAALRRLGIQLGLSAQGRVLSGDVMLRAPETHAPLAREVFISYAPPDKLTADAVCDALEQRGIRCWIAPRDILPGEAWTASIVDALSDVRVIVLVLSGLSSSYKPVLREVRYGADNGKIIVPFRIQDVQISGQMEFLIGGSHQLDALTQPLEPHLDGLASTLEAMLSQARGQKIGRQPNPPDPILVELRQDDILRLPADVLILKYADGFHGADQQVATRLEHTAGIERVELEAAAGTFALVDAKGALRADRVLYHGVGPLHDFGYSQIEMFARKSLIYLHGRAPETQHVATTIHGPGYGLDEREALYSLLEGFTQAIRKFDYPRKLNRISVVEYELSRALRVRQMMDTYFGTKPYATRADGDGYHLAPFDQS